MPPKVPAVNKGAASIILFYYGKESKYESLAQDALQLKKAMEGYQHKVLLKHDSLPGWADLSEQDEKLADIKDPPTKANLFKYLVQLTTDGYYTDLYIFSHGFTQKFMVSNGSYGSEGFVTTNDISNELKPDKTGFTKIPIRIVWGTNCYGQTLGATWRSIGAKTTAGARFVEFYPHAFGNFINDWNKGNVSFDSAVGNSDTDAVRTAAQLYISTIHAPSTNKEWGKCPFGKTVLGDDPCAKDYFLSMWLDNGEWQTNMNGTMLVHEAYLRLSGYPWKSPTHYLALDLALASRAMRQFMIDYLRAKMAQKRDGAWLRVAWEDTPGSAADVDLNRILDIDKLLDRLAEEDPRKASVVEMRFFGGLEFSEIAERLKVSLITVKRDWQFCRAWLFEALTGVQEA